MEMPKPVRAPIYNFGPKDIPTIPRMEPEAADACDWEAIKRRISEVKPVDWDAIMPPDTMASASPYSGALPGFAVQTDDGKPLTVNKESVMPPLTAAPIDLTKLQPGDTVKFRCGGSAKFNMGIDGKLFFDECCYGNGIKYWANGLLGRRDGHRPTTNEKHPFDIIEIVRKPFDWATAKPGMAFAAYGLYLYLYCGEIVHYVGPALGNSEMVVTASGNKDTTLKYTLKRALTRHPEKDIQL